MIKNTSSQTGSAHVAMIAILIVALVGALGFIFWQTFTAKNAQTATGTSSMPNTQQTNGTTRATTPSERFVTLSDWGVKFKLDDRLIATTIAPSKDKQGSDAYYIDTERSIQAAHARCPSQSVSSPELFRYADKPDTNAEGHTADMQGTLVYATPVNGYYYVYVQYVSYCPEGDSRPSASDLDVAAERETVLASLRTMQVAK